MNRNKQEYEAPQIKYWSAEQIDAIEATMSGGQGCQFNLTDLFKGVYILFAPILIGSFPLPFDHVAFLLEHYDGTGVFYSFATDPNVGIPLVFGCDGRLSTAIQYEDRPVSDNPEEIKRKPKSDRFRPYLPALVSMDEIVQNNGKIEYSDLYSVRRKVEEGIEVIEEDGKLIKFDSDSHYYQFLKIHTDDVEFGSEAVAAVYLAAESIRARNATNPRQYSLLWNNCADCVLDCLRWSDSLPIELEYDIRYTAFFVNEAINCMIAVGGLLKALGMALQLSFILGGLPTIPNNIYDHLIGVTIKNSPVLCTFEQFKDRDAQ